MRAVPADNSCTVLCFSLLPCIRLRCPAAASPDGAGLRLADRCTRLCPASSATGSAGQRGRSVSFLRQFSIEFVGATIGRPCGRAMRAPTSTNDSWCGKRSFTFPCGEADRNRQAEPKPSKQQWVRIPKSRQRSRSA